jgi:MFS family permease
MAEMHFDVPRDLATNGRSWYREITGYHWFVLLVASLGWMFDCLDQQFFVLGRPAAMKELLTGASDKEIGAYSDIATAIFLMGWATGGLIFGVLGDRIGRAKTMLITILIYSVFTGMCSLSQNFWQFAVFRFLTDLGVGGEFAVGVALVAETMPSRARAPMLTLLQMLSTVGNITAALINMKLGLLEGEGSIHSPWRWMFALGALPALLALLIRWKLKEPERWKQLSTEAAVEKQLGSYANLFRNPRWRRNAFVGLALAISGVVGLWGVGFYTPDLVKSVLREKLTVAELDRQIAQTHDDPASAANFQQLKSQWESTSVFSDKQPLPEKIQTAVSGSVTYWGGVSSICFQIGAFTGMFVFGYTAQRIGRKPTFAIFLSAACFFSIVECLFLDSFHEIFWMVPLVGFFQLSLFAGYAVYFPELFPTSLRSTGTSFCYNVGRFIGVPMLLAKAGLRELYSGYPDPSPLRYAGTTMCAVFLVGLIALPFAPETLRKSLPE